MFFNVMSEPLQVLVRSTKPTTLLEVVEKARDLQHFLPKARTFLQQKTHSRSRETMLAQDLEGKCVTGETHNIRTFSKKDASAV